MFHFINAESPFAICTPGMKLKHALFSSKNTKQRFKSPSSQKSEEKRVNGLTTDLPYVEVNIDQLTNDESHTDNISNNSNNNSNNNIHSPIHLPRSDSNNHLPIPGCHFKVQAKLPHSASDYHVASILEPDREQQQSTWSCDSLQADDCSLARKAALWRGERHSWCSSTDNMHWLQTPSECGSIGSQRRWSMATKKVKNILAVSNALVVNKRKCREREEIIEQTSNFLEKFSTRNTNVDHKKSRSMGEIVKQRASRASCGSNSREKNGDTPERCSTQANGYEMRRMYKTTEKSESLSDKSQSYTETEFQRPGICWRLLHILFEPYSSFVYFWSWVLLFTIYYNCWVIIFRTAFHESQKNNPVLWRCFDVLADLVYLFDVLVSSRMSHLRNGIYVSDVKEVSLAYFKSKKFLVDLLSLLPIEVLCIWGKCNPIYRIPRLIKFLKVLRVKKVVESVSNNPDLLRGLFWLHVMFLLMHWNACFYFIISEAEGFGSNKWVYPKWDGVHRLLLHRYIKSMYWSTLILTTIGESDPPESTLE